MYVIPYLETHTCLKSCQSFTPPHSPPWMGRLLPSGRCPQPKMNHCYSQSDQESVSINYPWPSAIKGRWWISVIPWTGDWLIGLHLGQVGFFFYVKLEETQRQEKWWRRRRKAECKRRSRGVWGIIDCKMWQRVCPNWNLQRNPSSFCVGIWMTENEKARGLEDIRCSADVRDVEAEEMLRNKMIHMLMMCEVCASLCQGLCLAI